jgi:hypothetical protein
MAAPDTTAGSSAHLDTEGYGTVTEALMGLYTGRIDGRKLNRSAPTCDTDRLPHPIRHFVDPSNVLQTQLQNGLRWRVGSGKRWTYPGAGYLYGAFPSIPGQTRGDVAGFHRRAPAPMNVQALWKSGPGSQPSNPGGPGKIAAPYFFNPMTG